jgi:uncharacterized protein with HEPN domain
MFWIGFQRPYGRLYRFSCFGALSDIRNKIIHHYFGVDYDIAWDTVKNNIPELKVWIEIALHDEKNQQKG